MAQLDHLSRNIDQNEEQDTQENSAQRRASMAEFSDEFRTKIENRELSFKQVVAMAREKREQAKERVDDLVKKAQKDNPEIINDLTAPRIHKKLEQAKDPKQVEEIMEDFENSFSTKEDQEQLSLDHEKIKEGIKEWEDYFKNPEVIKYIGTDQVKGFTEWGISQIKKDPSIATLKRIKHDRKHGKEGVGVREKTYKEKVAPLLKEYDTSIEETTYLKAKGQSEREEAVKEMRNAAKELEGTKNLGLYDQKSVRTIMKQLFKENDIGGIKDMVREIDEITAMEARSFPNQNSSVFKKTIRVKVGDETYELDAMSDASVKEYISYYQGITNLKERKKQVPDWPKMVEREAELARDLGKIYENDKEGFKKAIGPFRKLDYHQKETYLKTQRKLKDGEDKETAQEASRISNEAINAIDKAKQKKHINKKTGDKFAAHFIDHEKEDSRFFDKKTGKVDIKKMQEGLDQLTATAPVEDRKKRNLAAYEKLYKEFAKLDEESKKLSPTDEANQKKRRETFYSEDYRGREKIIKETKEYNVAAKKNREISSEIENQFGPGNESAEARNALKASGKNEVMALGARQLIRENPDPVEVQEAIDSIIYYRDNVLKSPEEFSKDPDLTDLLIALLQKSKTLYKPDQSETDRRVDEELDEMEDEMESQVLRKFAVEESEKNIRKHGGTESAKERSLKETLQHTNDEEEREAAENFYKISDYRLDDEGKGDEIRNLYMTDAKILDLDREKEKRAMAENSTRVSENKGINDINLVNKDGQEISIAAAKKSLEESNQKFEDKVVERVSDQMNEDKKITGNDPIDIQQRIAMRRRIEAKEAEKEQEIKSGKAS